MSSERAAFCDFSLRSLAQNATAYAESAEGKGQGSTAASRLAVLRRFFKDNPTWK